MENRRSTQMAGIIRSVVARFAVEITPDQATAVSIANVKISEDLQYADVYVSALTGAEAAARILKSRIRDIAKTVSGQVSTYAIPMIRFHADHRGEELDRLDKLIERLIPNTTASQSPKRRKGKGLRGS